MKFTDFFRDDAPYSSLRLLQFIFFLLFSIGWIYVTLRTKLMADIPIGLQVVVGLLLGGKVLQKGIEVYQARVMPSSAVVPGTKTDQAGFVRFSLMLFLAITLSVILAIATFAHAETRKEMKERLRIASGASAEEVDLAFDFSREAYRVNAVYTAEIDALRERLNLKPLCKGEDCSKEYPWLTNAKVREYEALEKFLVGGGTAAIIKSANTAGCFDRIKIVGGKEVKQCWSAIRPAGRDSKWECREVSRSEKPECYEAAEQ